jgi:DNA repair protein SbcC/Rad50
MKPLKLIMQAFGPYREEETVDFAELAQNRVFLIHGDTGAGKTTILDAIVFALYGETSGGERRADQMRCESAPDDLATQVTFDFSLGAKTFRVKRRPGQEIVGARGAKVSKVAEATLWDRTGCGEGEEGKPLSTKIREVDARVKDELGFSCDQFRQVVVLPQGRFRELLSAGSDKREEILRQLFKTARFRQLEEALAERAKAVREQMAALKAERSAQLKVVDAADDAELAAFWETAHSECEVAAVGVGEAQSASLQADEILNAAEAAVEARVALAAALAELERLEALGPEVAVLRLRIGAATRAEKVLPAADKLADARSQLGAAAAARSEADEALVRAREAEQTGVEALAAENARLPEREAATNDLRRLENLTTAIEAWRTAGETFAGAQSRAHAVRQAGQEALDAKGQAERALSALTEKFAAATAAAVKVESARARFEGIKQHEDRCRRLVAARDAVEAVERLRAGLALAESKALDDLTEAEAALTGLEERWRMGRAAALAGALEPGAPCPVCGATDHPAPARAGQADVSDEELGAGKSRADGARRAHSQAHEATAGAMNEAAAAEAVEQSIRQEPGARPDMALAWAESAVAACRAELEDLTAQAEAGELEAQISAGQAAVAEARALAEEASAALVSEEKALAAAEALLNERAAQVPAELCATGALEAAIDGARRLKQGFDHSFEAAQRVFTEAKEGRIARETAATAAAEAHAGAAENENACLGAFGAALLRHSFATEEDWHGALLPEQERASLQADVQTYDEALQQAKGGLQQAGLAVAGQTEPADIALLRHAADTARAARDAAITRQADAKNALAKLAKARQSLAEVDARSDEVRRTYETVGVLAEVANGTNAGRVSFQRWVLGVYLDEVLVGASRKLFAMSKGRYQLQRQREASGGRRPSGLDLAVFDEFSGTPRPAVTLSGGESFLAALSLALGLAETVQEHAAGVPLETIFVDEGFGALDSDALELAIDALMELQLGGRLVGVISHVPELRQVIPARLEVHGGSGGSHTKFVVP